MEIEILIYAVLICMCNARLRVIHAKKNGCFYGKTLTPTPPLLKTDIDNIHYLSTPEWYLQFGAMFFSIFAITRLLNYNTNFVIILLQLTSTMLITMGTSASVSYLWQKWINIGSNLPEDWDYPNNKSEFALHIFGKSIHFWWNRPFSGKGRIIAEGIGIGCIIIGIYLTYIETLIK